jgi:hypothetical protein
MKLAAWRTTALVLAAVCGYQRWQSCGHAGPPAATAATTTIATPEPQRREAPALPPARREPTAADASPALPGRTFHGFRIPAWALKLAPQPGETLRAYRDRMLPLAELAIAPQRARVARTRDDFAGLDPHQRAELDAAVQDAATAIEDRVKRAIAAGELAPATFKPMAGVTVARDILDIVDRGNTRFVTSLTPEQRTALASHRFDFADYLAFSARWEDALHALD